MVTPAHFVSYEKLVNKHVFTKSLKFSEKVGVNVNSLNYSCLQVKHSLDSEKLKYVHI